MGTYWRRFQDGHVARVISAIAQGGLTGPLTKRWGEASLIKATLGATAAGYIGIALPATFATFLLAIGLFTLATALMTPAINSLTSQRSALPQGIAWG